MLRTPVLLATVILAHGAAAWAQPCDQRLLRAPAETARDNIIASIDGAEAIRAWRHVVAHGSAVAWT